MLINFRYDIDVIPNTGSYGNTISGLSNSRILDLSPEDVIRQWGNRYSSGNNNSNNMILVDIKNDLMFSILSTGINDDIIMSLDIKNKEIYLHNSMSDLYNYPNSNGPIPKASANYGSPYDLLDWGVHNYKDKEGLCIKVPDECFDDFYEVLLPYIKFNYKQKLVSIIQNLGNVSARAAPQDYEVDYKNIDNRFKISCNSTFWEIFSYDFINGTLFDDLNSTENYITSKIHTAICGLNSHYLNTGNVDYDPRT